MAQQDPKKSDEQLAAEKAAAEKAAADTEAAKAAPPPPKRPAFVVAPDQSVVTHLGILIDAGGEVKPTDFHAESAKSRSNFDDLMARGAIVKG